MATKRQTEIPGTERFSNSEIDEVAEEFRILRDTRMQTATKENEAKLKLIAKMQAHGQTTYGYVDQDGFERTVKLDSKINAKVAKVKGQGKSDDDQQTTEGSDNGGGGSPNVDVH